MKKKALIIVDHGSSVEEANDTLARVAELVRSSGKSGFGIVKYCHMELAEPTIGEAFDACVAEGASHIVVHPYFLVPGKHSKQDIPRMVAEAAGRHKGVSYNVTEPLGVHEKIIEVILERASADKMI
ncbi:MAG: CbiX/SirB N-terminal domain-containing protein [Thermodesulfobacteriota bacterium]